MLAEVILAGAVAGVRAERARCRRARSGWLPDHVAAQCFFTIALALRELADALTERDAGAA